MVPHRAFKRIRGCYFIIATPITATTDLGKNFGMYTPGQAVPNRSTDSLASSIHSEFGRQRLIPRGSNLENIDEFMVKEASRSRLAKQQGYMATLQAGKKIRSSLPPPNSRSSSRAHIKHSHVSNGSTISNSPSRQSHRQDMLDASMMGFNASSSRLPSSSSTKGTNNTKYRSTTNNNNNNSSTTTTTNNNNNNITQNSTAITTSMEDSQSSSSNSSSHSNSSQYNQQHHRKQGTYHSRQNSTTGVGGSNSMNTPHHHASSGRRSVSGSHPGLAPLSPPAFLRALNDVFFAKFCVDELYPKNLRDQLVRRVQEGAASYSSEDLHAILGDVVRATKSTKLNLDAVAQWRLSLLDQPASAQSLSGSGSFTSSVIDCIFLTNANIMCFNPQAALLLCPDPLCVDPICCKVHSEIVTEYDKAKAFRRMLNMVLNEALRIRFINAEQKMNIRARLVSMFVKTEERVSILREIGALLLTSQTDQRYKDLVLHALLNIGKPSSPMSKTMGDDIEADDSDTNLDGDKVYRKAVASANSPFLQSYLSVNQLRLGIEKKEQDKLLELWHKYSQSHSTSNPNRPINLTLPMLLYLLIVSPDEDIGAVFSGKPTVAYHKTRTDQIEDAALQAAQFLGFSWEMGDRQPKNLNHLCMALIMELGSIFDKFVINIEEAISGNTTSKQDCDAKEIGGLEEEQFMCWRKACQSVVKFERSMKRVSVSSLVTYLMVASESLLGRKTRAAQSFQADVFLTLFLELLTEYRKRRPVYEAIHITADGRLSIFGGRDKSGKIKKLGRNTCEEIGGEFDQLYWWVDKVFSKSHPTKALVAPKVQSSPHSRTNSQQNNQITPPPTQSQSQQQQQQQQKAQIQQPAQIATQRRSQENSPSSASHNSSTTFVHESVSVSYKESSRSGSPQEALMTPSTAVMPSRSVRESFEVAKPTYVSNMTTTQHKQQESKQQQQSRSSDVHYSSQTIKSQSYRYHSQQQQQQQQPQTQQSLSLKSSSEETTAVMDDDELDDIMDTWLATQTTTTDSNDASFTKRPQVNINMVHNLAKTFSRVKT
ncbi:hypothetical protein H4219_003587 [Mycoemilia scoparia]|uniref:Uncharacterized protein n=1 Tax=Mycoemilia scoparia TaxID=417184 RepID=A0A9W7ZUA7_9FUNG|nr:hypothetical protein H4219_003587 [Mycoemilia scoparia]